MAHGERLKKRRERVLNRLTARYARIELVGMLNLEPAFEIIRKIIREDWGTSPEAIARDLEAEWLDDMLHRIPGLAHLGPSWVVVFEAIVTLALHRVDILKWRITRLERKLGVDQDS